MGKAEKAKENRRIETEELQKCKNGKKLHLAIASWKFTGVCVNNDQKSGG